MRSDETLHVRRKRCPNCGMEVSYRDTVCRYCGQVLVAWKIRRRTR